MKLNSAFFKDSLNFPQMTIIIFMWKITIIYQFILRILIILMGNFRSGKYWTNLPPFQDWNVMRLDPEWYWDRPLWIQTQDICKNIARWRVFVQLRMLSYFRRNIFSGTSVPINTHILTCTKETIFYLSRIKKESLVFSVHYHCASIICIICTTCVIFLNI